MSRKPPSRPKPAVLPPALARVFEAALASHRGGDPVAAATGYQRVLATVPAHVDSLHLLGLSLHQQGQNAAAVQYISKAIALAPRHVDCHINLANAHHAAGNPEAAIASLSEALKLQPGHPVALNNLGNALAAAGRIDEAEEFLRQAAAAGYTAAWSNLGALLMKQGRSDEALECQIAAAEAQPDSPHVLYNLAHAYDSLGKMGQAALIYQQVLELMPTHADTWNNLGIVLGRLGQIKASGEAFETAMTLVPGNSTFHSNRIFFLDYDERLDAAVQQQERAAWWRRHVAPLAWPVPAHANVRDPARKLRVGYVSADFLQHSAASTFAPMLHEFDREAFDVYAYANQTRHDAITEGMRASVTVWRDIFGLDDDKVAAMVMADGIDILVDLSGHSAGNRLLVFARRPAPLQITAWGHANGTGMPEIDVLFTDPVTIAEANRALYAEHLVDLPCTLTYAPHVELPTVGPLPMSRNGYVTFGCFNRSSKIGNTVIAAWAEILAVLPAARLLIKSPELSEQLARDDLLGRLVRHGIAADRITLLGRSDQHSHLAAFNQVDICLDPFPHGGGVSSYDALWMGVPIVCLLGQTQVGRLAAGIVSAVGLGDWVADSPGRYVALAVKRASDPDALASLRMALRAQTLGCAAGNPKAYVGAVEARYRELWAAWCAQA